MSAFTHPLSQHWSVRRREIGQSIQRSLLKSSRKNMTPARISCFSQTIAADWVKQVQGIAQAFAPATGGERPGHHFFWRIEDTVKPRGPVGCGKNAEQTSWETPTWAASMNNLTGSRRSELLRCPNEAGRDNMNQTRRGSIFSVRACSTCFDFLEVHEKYMQGNSIVLSLLKAAHTHRHVYLNMAVKAHSPLKHVVVCVCVMDMPFTAVTLLSPLRSVETSVHRTMMQMGRSTRTIERSMHRRGAPSRNINRRLNRGLMPVSASARCPWWPGRQSEPRGDSLAHRCSETQKGRSFYAECIEQWSQDSFNTRFLVPLPSMDAWVAVSHD